MGHLVLNLQPFGGSVEEGGIPFRAMISFLAFGFGSGAAEYSPFVYGWSGFLDRSFEEASSMILPRYITATLSEMYLTTARSWVMNRQEKLNCARSCGNVQGRRRLIRYDEPGIDYQSPGYDNPLFLSAAEFMWISLHVRWQ